MQWLSRSTTDGTGLLQWMDTTHELNLEVRHAALIINFPTYITRLSILCMMHRNVPYKHYSGQHNQCDIRAAHDGKVRCDTVEYTTAFLYSDWLYFLCHGIPFFQATWRYQYNTLSKRIILG